MKIQGISFQKTRLDVAFISAGCATQIEDLLEATVDRDCLQWAVEETIVLLMKQMEKRRNARNVTFGRWWSAFSSRRDAIQFLSEAASFGDEIRLHDKAYQVFNDAYLVDHPAELEEIEAPSLSSAIGRLNTFGQLVGALRLALERDGCSTADVGHSQASVFPSSQGAGTGIVASSNSVDLEAQ